MRALPSVRELFPDERGGGACSPSAARGLVEGALRGRALTRRQTCWHLDLGFPSLGHGGRKSLLSVGPQSRCLVRAAQTGRGTSSAFRALLQS